jgi:SAM-dependent MidA family methyltransferase
MTVSEIIKQKISDGGPISFCDFMDMCLYYPELGYYTSTRDKIGWSGDYYTSPYVSRLFGVMIAKQLEEMWRILGDEKFVIVEYGAGTGLMCYNILEELKKNKDLYEQLNYCIIEKSGAMRQKQKENLNEKVSWHKCIQDIAPVNGCILSNEVVDNFCVHQVIMKEELMEVFVGFDNGFFELLKPASVELKEYFEELKITLEKGFRTEINLQAKHWMKEIGQTLQKGFVLTIDYGFPSFELYSSRRSEGTILCYHQHRVHDDPYNNIGEQDITAHVNFSALHHWGLKNGLEYTGFTNQAYFLLSLGLTEQLRMMEKELKHDEINSIGSKAALINSLLLDMGTKLKVLIQHKGLLTPQLSGLKFPINLFRDSFQASSSPVESTRLQ